MACYGLAFNAGFGTYVLAMDYQSYLNVGDVEGNRPQVRGAAAHAVRMLCVHCRCDWHFSKGQNLPPPACSFRCWHFRRKGACKACQHSFHRSPQPLCPSRVRLAGCGAAAAGPPHALLSLYQFVRYARPSLCMCSVAFTTPCHPANSTCTCAAAPVAEPCVGPAGHCRL